MKYRILFLFGAFNFLCLSTVFSQHLYCKHKNLSQNFQGEPCDPIYTQGGNTYVDHVFSIFLPSELLAHHEFILSVNGQSILNEPSASITIDQCSDANSSIYYQELECSEYYDILEYQGNLAFQIPSGVCGSPWNGSINFEMCLRPFSEPGAPGEPGSNNNPIEILASCLLPDGSVFTDLEICFPLSVSLCCSEGQDDDVDIHIVDDEEDPISIPKEEKDVTTGGRESEIQNSDETKSKRLSVFPNPASQIITLQTKFDHESLILYNSQGEVQKRFFFPKAGNHSVDISMLNAGLYIFLSEASTKVETQKFIKI